MGGPQAQQEESPRHAVDIPDSACAAHILKLCQGAVEHQWHMRAAPCVRVCFGIFGMFDNVWTRYESIFTEKDACAILTWHARVCALQILFDEAKEKWKPVGLHELVLPDQVKCMRQTCMPGS